MSPEEFRKLFPRATEDVVRRNTAPNVEHVAAASVPKRLRQKSKGLNKTEAAFLLVLQQTYPHCFVESQAVTLLIGNGVRYTPDFTVAFYHGDKIQDLLAYETKGFMRDDASVKIKVAATRYPWIKFRLVTKHKKKDGGGWNIQEILS